MRFRARRQAALLVLGGDEGVDRIADRGLRIADCRNGRALHGLERPPRIGAAVLGESGELVVGGREVGGGGLVGRVAGEVAGQQLDQVRGPVAVAVLVGDGVEAGGDVGLLAGLEFVADRGETLAERVVRLVLVGRRAPGRGRCGSR